MSKDTTKNGRVLVTGSEGYIGSVLVPSLIARGYEVLAVDSGWFAEAQLIGSPNSISYRCCDIRDLEVKDLLGCQAVVHLAALCNDPLGELDPELTMDINYRATVRLADIARAARVPRFIFSSSCSMYGVSCGDQALTESAPFNPQTAYARSKVEAERELKAMADDSFCPVMLRNGTAFGISPRQRFDLVVPNLAGNAHVCGEVRLVSDGTPWRPIVHIRDISLAFHCAIAAPLEDVCGEAFNIGRDEDNHRIRDIAERVRQGFPGSRVILGTASANDTRSYRVSFTKAAQRLSGFCPKWDLQRGIEECRDVFQKIQLDADTFAHRLYTRLKQVRHLLDCACVDDQLRWRERPADSGRCAARNSD